MSDCSDDYLLVYRRFFDNFASSVDLNDQLPVKVAGYNLSQFEIQGAVTDWCLQYLNQRQCPSNLIAPLVRVVVDEINEFSKKHPESCGYRPNENDFLSLKLMQVTMRKLIEVCGKFTDNAQLSTLPAADILALNPPMLSACAIKNSRRTMEDRHITLDDFHALFNIQGHGTAGYYAVFDGHNGLDAAIYSVAHLHQYLAESTYYPTDPVNALKDAFRRTDQHFINKSNKENLQSGTTAVCALFRPKDHKLYVAWLGDSQAVLVKQGCPQQLVRPHKPDRADEKERVEQMGGTVLYWGMWRVNGQLAVSRAIGDVKYKPYVSADPDVVTINLDGTEDMLILACDGLWDHVSEQEATNAVYNYLLKSPGDVEGVSQQLVALAKDQGSTDNISVVVVFLAEPLEVTQRRPMETASPNPFVKQNGADLYCGVPTNGKLRPYDDEDDFGPETDVDMVDDVLLSPAIAAAKKLVTGKKDYDDDLEIQRQQMSDFDPADLERSRDTPTPPAHEVAGNVDADNLTESGEGEDSEEDEWNFIPGVEEKKPEENTEEEEDDMSSQLNPNAAEFVPVSPKRSPVEDPDVSSSSLCFEKAFDNVSIPTQSEFACEVSSRPGQLDLLNGQKDDHPQVNELNDSSIIVAHQTLDDTTKAEFGDSIFESSLLTNPFSTSVNPFSDSNTFDAQNLTNPDHKDAFEPVRNIKEFKTFAECAAEPKRTKSPEVDDVVPDTPKSTVVEAPISPSSDVSPLDHLDDKGSPDIVSPSEEPHEAFTGQEPTSSSGFESESGADEAEPNLLGETNLVDSDGFILETKRLSPPIQTLSFKPIETFSDKNPFGLLENPSPIYKPKAVEAGHFSSVDKPDLISEAASHEHNTQDFLTQFEAENTVQDVKTDISESLGLKQNAFAFGGVEPEIKPNEFIFGASSDTPLENAEIKMHENEESKIRQDEQESEQKVEAKDAAFGVDSEQKLEKTFESESLLLGDFNSSANAPKEDHELLSTDVQQSREFEPKESDFQFEPTNTQLDFATNDFNSDLKDMDLQLESKIIGPEIDVLNEQFDTTKEISSIHENEKESDSTFENILDIESQIIPKTVGGIEGASISKTSNEQLKIDVSNDIAKDHGAVSPLNKVSSPLSPSAPPFIPVPVVEPPFTKVIVEKKFSELDDEDAEDSEENISNILTQENLTSQIPQLDSDTQVCLSEPYINVVRENIDEIIKEAKVTAQVALDEGSTNDHLEVEKISQVGPQPVREVLQNELIVHTTEPIPDLLHSIAERESDKEQNGFESLEVQQVTDVMDLKDVTSAGTPPPTPAPGVVKEEEEAHTGLLAAAAVAAAGAITAAAVTANKPAVKKAPLTQAKKPTTITKKPEGVAKPTTKPASAAAKPASTTAKPAAASKPATTASKVTATAKPAAKPAASKPIAAVPAKVSAKPAVTATAAKPGASPVSKTTAMAKAKPAPKPSTQPPSKPSTPVSKPSTPTGSIRPASAKSDSGKTSPTKPLTSPKPSAPSSKPTAKIAPTKKIEKLPLTNGDIAKPALKKTEVSAVKKTTTATRPLVNSATSKPAPKAAVPTTKAPGTLPAAKPSAPKAAPPSKPKPATTTKPMTKPTPVPKSRPPSATAGKTVDKTGKDTANKQISEKVTTKTVTKTITKKTDAKATANGKAKPVAKANGEVKKEIIEVKVEPTQVGEYTNTNGYSDIIENGLKKDDSPMDNSHEAVLEAMN